MIKATCGLQSKKNTDDEFKKAKKIYNLALFCPTTLNNI